MKNSSKKNKKMVRNKYFMCFSNIKKAINYRVLSDGTFLSPSWDIMIEDNTYKNQLLFGYNFMDRYIKTL